ncbi:MAG: sodium-dependent transporter [Sulfurospirillaceae bacterium]|nr:sodium-dependent transporter [Sulfurospirillaceae bacterium]MDD3463191.1 sodium-dependent transporter [Sulfurospirillaceae bacterium]
MHGARFSKFGFIMASAGSAVGLGNIWKFPYMTGENGGGAFVLIYLLTITFVGLSLFLAEVVIGRLSRGDAVSAFESLAPRNGNLWKYSGFMIFTGILILSFYTIVIGWIFKYIYVSAFSLPSSVKEAGSSFGGMLSADTTTQTLFFTLAFFVTFFIVSKGVKQGIEKINLILMPLLVIILLILLAYSFTLSGFGKAVAFLFVPDFSKVHSSSILAAVGHAFFTLSLGMGTIMTYAASIPKDANIAKSSLMVAVLDTVIALVAGLVIFSFLFHFNAEPSQGPGLIFISLPPLFYQLGILGNAIGVLFFMALAFAGITSAVSIVEPTVMYMIDRFKISRTKSLVILSAVVYLLGMLALLSNIDELKKYVTFFGKGFFDIFDFLSSSVLLPLGGILIAIFVGFVIEKNRLYSLLSPFMSDSIFNLWYFSIKYITPIGVFAVMINKIFF